MRRIFDRLFGGGNEGEIARLKPLIEEINSFEAKVEELSDSRFTKKTNEFKERLAGGEGLDNIAPEAFAVAREAAKREIGQRHFDVQLMGGIVLHQGKIAEMKTGEGKTLVATLSLYLNALEGKGAHLVTVNDYLAKFQGEWMGRIYDRLGLTVGIIQNQGVSFFFERGWGKKNKENEENGGDKTIKGEVEYVNLRPCSRKEAYEADITYGTNNEFGFDYLRDNMAQDKSRLTQRGLNFAIVDEVDSILIDEARTPLIISSPAEESTDLYLRFSQIASRLTEKSHYQIDEKAKAVSLTDEGVEEVEKILGVKNIYHTDTINFVHHLEEALKARALFERDRDYLVKDGEVVIVDEFTGRLMPGRRYSEGLHQAIEAKEGVEIKRESETLATISFQNFFRLYDKLSGMTGTAATEAEEFNKIYKLEVVEVPTHRPMVRRDLQDQIYKTAEAKYKAIVEKIRELNERGQPILVGTVSVAKSEYISTLLRRAGVKHEVLNAKNHEREARIIAQAGQPSAVTVATNMAGRGVDIILGGTPPKPEQARKVVGEGGLFVIGTERHESRRIDNQLRGRSGRQGDPGASQFYISTEDDLMRIFGGDRMKRLMERLGLPDDQPIIHNLVSKSIESAQRRVEGHNFDIRKHLVEYDDVMNKQREVLYRRRQRILLMNPNKDDFLHGEFLSKLNDEETKEFKEKTKKVPVPALFELERRVYLSLIDKLWIQHLNTMDQLRDSIGLRGYGQVDPLIAYKQESFALFQRLLHSVDDEAANILLRIDFQQVSKETLAPPPAPAERSLQYRHPSGAPGGAALSEAAESERSVSSPTSTSQSTASASAGVITTTRSVGERMQSAAESGGGGQASRAKVGRNEPCTCGSGKKFKKCHGR